jgi:hypothetical protein
LLRRLVPQAQQQQEQQQQQPRQPRQRQLVLQGMLQRSRRLRRGLL